MTKYHARGRKMTAKPSRELDHRNDPSGLSSYALSGSAAEMYERNMVPAIFEPFAYDLLAFGDLKSGERVLDVACGTGIVARLAWPKVAPTGRVVGLDANAGMLEVAKLVSRQRGLDIDWAEANVSEMPLESGAFDVVFCQHGLQYFPHRPAALNEMRRVLDRQGRLVLNTLRHIRFNAGHAVFADVLQRRVSNEAAETRRAPFQLSDRNEIRTLVAGAGFQDVIVSLTTRMARFASADAMVRIMMAGTPLGAAMNNANPEVLQAVIDDVAEGLAEYVDDRGLAIPMQGWVVTARRTQ
jgi:ubiquinone/menaquinone biosynthesis C-methylase UbiE